MTEIEMQIARAGFAEVLVVLKPEKRARQDGRLALDFDATRDLQAEAAKNVEHAFTRFERSREVVLAKELRARHKTDYVRQSAAESPEPPAPRAKAVRYYPNIGVMLGTIDHKGLAALHGQDADVRAVTPVADADLIAPQFGDELALAAPEGISWGIRRLKADQLWQQGLTGDGVLIGHIDTGVDGAHPAIVGPLDAFAEYDLQGEQVPGAVARDSKRHGTHTAGLMVGQEFEGFRFGVAPGAKLASAMVIEGGNVTARLLGGLNWCVGQGAKIINISLGFRGYQTQYLEIIRLLRQRDILPVCAIGNDGVFTSRSPGNFRESLAVGAIDESDTIWTESSSDGRPQLDGYTKPDVVAPGVNVWSSVPNGKLFSFSGTSMAAPHISGLAALLWQAVPTATANQIEAAIFKSAKRPPDLSTTRGNRGVPDGIEALSLLRT